MMAANLEHQEIWEASLPCILKPLFDTIEHPYINNGMIWRMTSPIYTTLGMDKDANTTRPSYVIFNLFLTGLGLKRMLGNLTERVPNGKNKTTC